MHFHFGHALIVAALAGSILLAMEHEDRLFPVIALAATGLEALLAFRIVSLSISTFRIDIILPAVVTVAGAICWGRSATKPSISAATVVLMVGLIQLLLVLSILN